jgi:hypothetical protein
VKALLTFPNIDVNRRLENTPPIHDAARIGDLELLNALLALKTLDKNAVDSYGNNAFDDVCGDVPRQVMQRLLDSGVRPKNYSVKFCMERY